MSALQDNIGAGQRLVVLGGGPGGYPAAFLAADAGYSVTIIEKDPTLGGVCLNRGCIPSKALLHAAKLINETREAADWGLEFAEPKLDIDKLREFTQKKVIGKMTGGLKANARGRKVTVMQGTGSFVDANTIRVINAAGEENTVNFDYCIIATGSSPTQIPIFPNESPLVWDSTDALKLEHIPETLLVVGGGYIGLEMATVYAALGTKVTVVEMLNRIVAQADPDLAKHLERRMKQTVEQIIVGTKVTEMSADNDKITVTLSGPDHDNSQMSFDRALISVGRVPNSKNIGLEHAGVRVTDRGFVQVDHQRRTATPHIFAIGDVAGDPMLAHKATYEAKVVVDVILGKASAYDPVAIPAVVFTDPELAWSGVTEIEAKEQGIPHRVLSFPWAASGRATTLGRSDGLTKMLIDPHNERVIGVGICGVGAGELIGEGTLAIETGALATDVMMTIHAHPTLSETVMEAAEMLHGASAHMAARR